jgi:hypothetical protein
LRNAIGPKKGTALFTFDLSDLECNPGPGVQEVEQLLIDMINLVPEFGEFFRLNGLDHGEVFVFKEI